MSFAVLSLEVSLTRMFAVMFAYHYAFLAVAITMAGLGLGGVVAQFVFSGVSGRRLLAELAMVYGLFSLLASAITMLVTSISPPNFVTASLSYFIVFLPAGVFLATTYRLLVRHANAVYAVDIAGAAVGSVAPMTLFNGFSPVITILLLCSVLAVMSFSLVFIYGRKSLLVVSALLVLLAGSMLFVSAAYARDVPIGNEQGKELYQLLNNPEAGARIVESRWSTFGRTDLVELKNDPHSKAIFIDGGAGTRLYHFNGDFNDQNNTIGNLWNSTLSFPFYFMNNGSALIVGPGGGVDVLTSLMFNFSHIHAVEINQETVDIVKEESQFDGGLYTDYSNVYVHVDEGRSFLKREGMKYDAIIFNIPVTRTIQGSSGYSLAENYLFTTDSFKDFLGNLNDDGYIVIVAHEHVELLKLVVTMLDALGTQGKSVQASMNHLSIVENMHHPAFPVFVFKKTPFDQPEAKAMLAKTIELGLNPVYFPVIDPEVKNALDPMLIALSDGKAGLSELINAGSAEGIDIAPATDDRPFFYKFENGLPFALPQLLAIFVIVAATLTVSYVISWGRRIFLAPKKLKQTLAGKFSIYMPYYFASLGLGFMLIEASFVQRFILFLGPPAFAISTIIFSMLISMGVGGFLSSKWKQTTNLILGSTLAVGTLLVAYIFVLPSVFNSTLSLDLTSRLVIAFTMTFPVGFCLGIPFPAGMRLLNERFERNDAEWMWGMNSVYSLLGSTLAVVIALVAGFDLALLLGGTVYLLMFITAHLFFRKQQNL